MGSPIAGLGGELRLLNGYGRIVLYLSHLGIRSED